MATWNPLTDTETGHKKPVVMGLFRRLRDMVLAVVEGAPGAPSLSFKALGTLEPGASIRSRIDAMNSTSSVSNVTVHQFEFIQTGTIRVTLQHKATGGGTSTVDVYRQRSGGNTLMATWGTASASYQARSVDIDVEPGDLVVIQHRTTSGAFPSDIAFMRFQTNGQNLWPGRAQRVEGNTL